ncbi:hypothetical protein LZ198_33620 [Myxococcus sp. K15C18031901]|uniref:hypothetical protein n=1 Tax=Myxococcus dinghuensis TaxID=2906761 RepID=UPI0020A7F3A2|nr:hypothetical protein [Myxococcus dinghuensis]MCP3103830.1 hypothetical protein [Myxococcus dinghuensis]
MRSTQEWSRLGGLVIAGLAVVAACAVLIPRLLGFAAGPEAEVITALKEAESQGVSLALPGVTRPLTSQKVRFARITVVVAPDRKSAEALATLDFEGTLGETRVGTAGVERVPFVYRDGGWHPRTSVAPRLVAVVSALEARRRGLEAADAESLARLAGPGIPGVGGPEWTELKSTRGRVYRAEAWYIRLEREDAVVTEHWRLQGSLPSRPVDTRGQRALSLTLHGDEFLFSPGLM